MGGGGHVSWLRHRSVAVSGGGVVAAVCDWGHPHLPLFRTLQFCWRLEVFPYPLPSYPTPGLAQKAKKGTFVRTEETQKQHFLNAFEKIAKKNRWAKMPKIFWLELSSQVSKN